jgi:hypothetical protein
VSDFEEPRALQMPVDKARELATECWRLGRLTKASSIFGKDRLVLDRTARRLNEILNSVGIRTIDFAGEEYDPGIVPEVLEVQIDPTLHQDSTFIDETVLPTIIWKDKVIQVGQIIVRQAPSRPVTSGEME